MEAVQREWLEVGALVLRPRAGEDARTLSNRTENRARLVGSDPDPRADETALDPLIAAR
jgi:hypothetical protein